MSSLRGQCSIYEWAVDLHLLYPFLGHTTSMAWLGALERTSRKQFLITFTSSLLYFYPWLPSAKMRGLLYIICIFSLSRELCLDSHDWINFLQIRAVYKTGPIMWALHETVSPFYFTPFPLLQKWKRPVETLRKYPWFKGFPRLIWNQQNNCAFHCKWNCSLLALEGSWQIHPLFLKKNICWRTLKRTSIQCRDFAGCFVKCFSSTV